MKQRFDPEIKQLIPHREPMLLINHLVEVTAQRSQSRVLIDSQTPFFVSGRGVPAWIGLEYMGQTAALIAGFQQREGLTSPHLGFLMGSRKYRSAVDYFAPDTELTIICAEAALVGESLATFNCTINTHGSDEPLAEAMLSVYRRPMDEQP